MGLISPFRDHLQCFPPFVPSGARKSLSVIYFGEFLKVKVLCSRDTTSLLMGQPTNSMDAGGTQCTCGNTVCRASYRMLSLQPKRLEWDSPQLKLDVYKRLNELRPPNAHLPLLTLKGNLAANTCSIKI